MDEDLDRQVAVSRCFRVGVLVKQWLGSGGMAVKLYLTP